MAIVGGITGLVAKAEHVKELVGPPYDQVLSGSEFHKWLLNRGTINNVTNARSIEEAKEAFSYHRENHYQEITAPSYFIYEQAYPMIGDISGGVRYGVFVSAEINSDVVLRHEMTFKDKVKERIELAKAIEHEVDPVLLWTPGELMPVLKGIVGKLEGEGIKPLFDFMTDFGSFEWSDLHGTKNRVFQVAADSLDGMLIEEALRDNHLIVLDGNHRYTAAEQGRQDGFLGVVSDQMLSLAYNKLVKTKKDVRVIMEELNARNVDEFITPRKGYFRVYTRQGIYEAGIATINREAGEGTAVERLDSSRVERMLYPKLGLTEEMMADQSVFDYMPGTNLDAMRKRVDNWEFDMAIALHPVSAQEVIDVSYDMGFNNGQPMGKKTTYFIPKLEAGFFARRIGYKKLN